MKVEGVNDIPKGITAVLIAPDGHVYATSSDFNTSGYGGHEMWEAQRIRARTACALDYIRNACNGDVAKAICDGYPGAPGVIEDLCRKQGYRLTCIAHGHDNVDPERL